MARLTFSQRIEIVFWVAFAAGAYALTYRFDRPMEMYRFGASGWPRVLIVLVLLAAVGQFVQHLRRGPGDDDPGAAGYFRELREMGLAHSLRMAGVLLLPLVFAGLLDYTGYYFTAPLFIAGYLGLTGERRPRNLILVPLIIYAILTVLFTRYLYVGLPVGYVRGFYDFSNWLVVMLR